MSNERVIVYCPDENIALSVDRLNTRATGGGKSAILRLGYAWAKMGHPVVIACPRSSLGKRGNLTLSDRPLPASSADIAIFVTGSRGHFDGWWEKAQAAAVKIFWINGPHRVQPPPLNLDWVVAPAQFLAQRAITEWGLPPEKVVVIRGESAEPYRRIAFLERRNPHHGLFFSHPQKGLDHALELLQKLKPKFPEMELHICGSERLWGDEKAPKARTLPEGAVFLGEIAPTEIRRMLPHYGFMPYLSPVLDGFSSATAEAMAAGLVVFAAAHGSNAEYIHHGWNGFLVPLKDGQVDLDLAEKLLASYLAQPTAFAAVRRHAREHVSSWHTQAARWRELWRQPLRREDASIS